MRIHSNSLDDLEVRKAARIAGVRFTRFGLHGSRSHAAAFDVILTGSSSRRQNQGEDYAATWDEWGMFLGLLFRTDPAMMCGSAKHPVYVNADDFHWQTNGRFQHPDAAFERAFERGHNHRWEFSGIGITGSYSAFECARGKHACGAVMRSLRGQSWTEFVESNR